MLELPFRRFDGLASLRASAWSKSYLSDAIRTNSLYL